MPGLLAQVLFVVSGNCEKMRLRHWLAVESGADLNGYRRVVNRREDLIRPGNGGETDRQPYRQQSCESSIHTRCHEEVIGAEAGFGSFLIFAVFGTSHSGTAA